MTTWEAKETPEKNVTTSGVVTACTDTTAPSLLYTAVVTESVQYPHTIGPSLLYTAVVTKSVQYPHSQFLQLLSRSLYSIHTVSFYSCCHEVCTVSTQFLQLLSRSLYSIHTVSTAVVTKSVQYPHSQFLQLLSRSLYSIHTVSTAIVTESVQYPHSQFLQLLSRSLYPRGSGVCDLLDGPQRKHGPPDKSRDHQTKARTTSESTDVSRAESYGCTHHTDAATTATHRRSCSRHESDGLGQ